MDEWKGTGWSEEKEQAYLDAWALRMRTCPIKGCRRTQTCRRRQDERNCPALKAHPVDAAETQVYIAALRTALKRDVAFADAHGDAAHDAMRSARNARHEAQKKLAWEQAKEAVRVGRGAG